MAVEQLKSFSGSGDFIYCGMRAEVQPPEQKKRKTV